MIQEAIKNLAKREVKEEPKAYVYLKGLNHNQQIAASRKEGNYLVIAGPGTGKTHTLVYRVVHLVKEGIDPKGIVVITFTRKAGNELKKRINQVLPNTSLGFIGTFHGFSNHLSMKYGSASPISKFRLLDSEDDVQVHKLVLAGTNDFNKKLKAKRLQKIISYCDNTALSIENYVNKFDLRDLREDIVNLENYKIAYENYKADHMLANYDDMIRLMTRFLEKEGHSRLLKDIDYLMIDEYQDTNQMQLDFIKKLAIKNVMAIGDDFQGIYAFRGADHRIILNFYNDFEDAKMIKLVENYRSTKEIIHTINLAIDRSNLGYHKTLTSKSSEKGVFEVVSGKSLQAHKEFILDSIDRYKEDSHALIYRYNKNRTVFEKALIEKGVDYSVYGGIRLLERKHIKDVLSFLMVSLNRRDVVSYNRMLTLLPGIGPKTAKKLMESNLENKKGLSKDKITYIENIEALLLLEPKELLFDGVVKFYMKLYEYIESDVYSKEDMLDDFTLVREILVTYHSLHNFIINLILDPVIDMHKGSNPKVILTTIHSAKGLEFDHVYYFHSHNWYENYDSEKLEEDRRLFYVGISRAKKYLYIFDHSEVKRDYLRLLGDFETNPYAYEDTLDFIEETPETYVSEIIETQKKTDIENKNDSTEGSRIVAFLIIFFLGPLGIHKFIKGDILKGLLYLFTLGGFGILWIFDVYQFLKQSEK